MRRSGEVFGIWHLTKFSPETDIQNIICHIGEKTGRGFGHTWPLPCSSACLHKQETYFSDSQRPFPSEMVVCGRNLIGISVHESALNSVALKTFRHRKCSSPALTVSHMEVIKRAFTNILHLPCKSGE